MRISDLIVETAQHDRALLSLSVAITRHIAKYGKQVQDQGHDPIKVGTVGELFNTPLQILEPLAIELQSGVGIRQTYEKAHAAIPEILDNEMLGLWMPDDQKIILNSLYLGSNSLTVTVTHELRHALDSYLSDFRAAEADIKYSRPHKSQARATTNDPYDRERSYLASRDEIGARFLEVLHQLTPAIHRAVKRGAPDLFNHVMQHFKQLLVTKRISELFPEGTESRDYRRLMSRAADYVTHEIAYARSKPKNEEWERHENNYPYRLNIFKRTL